MTQQPLYSHVWKWIRWPLLILVLLWVGGACFNACTGADDPPKPPPIGTEANPRVLACDDDSGLVEELPRHAHEYWVSVPVEDCWTKPLKRIHGVHDRFWIEPLGTVHIWKRYAGATDAQLFNLSPFRDEPDNGERRKKLTGAQFKHPDPGKKVAKPIPVRIGL